MLVLKRKIGEHIQIGDTVRLILLGASKTGVLLGFDCAEEIRIVRGELWTPPVATKPRERGSAHAAA